MSTTIKPPFELSKLPFCKDLPMDDIYAYPQLEELKHTLRLAVEQKSTALITGQAGVGKTTAVHAVISELPTNKYTVVYLGQDQDGSNLIRRLAAGLGLQPKRFRTHAWMQISQLLADNLTEQGKTPVVVIDEAHLLDDITLEDLRLLTNADFDRSSPLVLILLGQLQLRTRLKAPGFEALNQRLRFRYALEGFTEEETAAYVKHHLRLAGLPEELFTDEALKLLFQSSRGIAREINNYATQALLKAQSAGASKIDGKLVRKVLDQRELN